MAPFARSMRLLNSRFVKLLIHTGWAPIAVLIFHRMIYGTPHRTALDFTIHFLGGASMGFCFFYALDYFKGWVGQTTPFGRYLFSFSLACVVGLFWEFAELFSDTYLRTHIQRTIRETLGDLIADASGAATALTLILIVRLLFKRRG